MVMSLDAGVIKAVVHGDAGVIKAVVHGDVLGCRCNQGCSAWWCPWMQV